MENQREPVVLRDVAKVAGVSLATASMALREDRRISRKTSLRINAIAKELGYRPDPVLSSLASYRRRSPRGATDVTRVIALLVSPEAESCPSWMEPVKASAVSRCEHYGFELQPFPLPQQAADQLSLSRQLFQRGVRGVLLTCAGMRAPELDWSAFCTVSLGLAVHSNGSRFHCCHDDLAGNLMTAMAQMARWGFKKIGYFHTAEAEELEQRRGCGAFLASQWQRLDHDPARLVFLPEARAKDWSQIAEITADWVHEQGLEAVITPFSSDEPVRHAAEEALARRREAVHWISLRLSSDSQGPGIDPQVGMIGRAAIDMLNGLLLRRDVGLPESSQNFLIGGIWRDPWQSELVQTFPAAHVG